MKRFGYLVFLLMLPALLLGCEKNASRQDFLMDTMAEISIYDSNNKEIVDRAFDRLYEIEKRMSKTISASDVSKINRQAGRDWLEPSQESYELIERALEFAELTEGAFDPTIGPLVDLWQIKEDHTREDIPSPEDIKGARDLVNYRELVLRDGAVMLKREGMGLDLGGIAKGYGADEAKKVLLEAGVNSALIDLGGNIYALGEKTNGEAWKIGIQNPSLEADSNRPIGVVSVRDKSIVTSGGYERFFKLGDRVYHHILDSRTGYPAESPFLSVTIVSDSSRDGDALATAFYVLGLEKTKEILRQLEGIDVIIQDKSGRIYISQGLENSFKATDEETIVELIN